MDRVEMNGKVWCKDARGNLILEESIKEIDIIRDDVVCSSARRIYEAEENLRKVKAQVFEDVQAYMGLAAEKYGLRFKGSTDGNLKLSSFDGSKRISFSVNETVEADENIYVAKEQIDEYLADITNGSNKDLVTIVNAAFKVKQGRMAVRDLLKLTHYDIRDERWKKAMEIIKDSIVVTGSRQYLRLEERIPNTRRYRSVDMNLSTL